MPRIENRQQSIENFAWRVVSIQPEGETAVKLSEVFAAISGTDFSL
jgi:hypothetical protein